MRKPIQSCEKILEEFRIILELEKKAAETYHQLAQDCDHPEVAQVLEKISREECEHAAIAARLGLSTLMSNTIALMADKRRLFVLPQFVTQLADLIAEEKGEVTAEVS